MSNIATVQDFKMYGEMKLLFHSFLISIIHYLTSKLYARGRFTRYATVHSTRRTGNWVGPNVL